MKNIMKKITGLAIALSIFVTSFILFAPSTGTAGDYYTTRVCSNGICIVTVYAPDGSIVNVYEELD